LLGLYGMALTVHTISQKVNEKYGFKSTSLMLAKSPTSVYKGIREDYPQPVSMLMDFLPLTRQWNTPVYLPRQYHEILMQIYKQFRGHPDIRKLPASVDKDFQPTDIKLNISYEGNSAVIVVRTYGDSFESSCLRIFKSLEELKLNAIYIDLPLNHYWVEPAVEWLRENKFICAGLIPMFHKNRDYLRMQKIDVDIDFDLIETYSEMSAQLKEKIAHEFHEVQKRP